MIVPNRLTALDASEAGRVLFAAYAVLTGKQPTDAVGALLLAQSALETGNWQKIHNYNFGNIKARADYPQVVQFRCSEVLNGVEQFFDPPDPHCNFRAYSNATDGAVDYLKVLHSQPQWWQGLHTGDPSAYVDALATPPKYFTANPATYKRTLTALFNQFRPLATAVLRSRQPAASVNPVTPVPPPAPVVAEAPSSPLPPQPSESQSSSEPSEVPSAVVPQRPEATGHGALDAIDEAAKAVTSVASAVRDVATQGKAKSLTPPPPPPRPKPPALPATEPELEEIPVDVMPPESIPVAKKAMDVAEDAANAIVVAADAAEAIVTVGGTHMVPQSGPAGRAIAIVRVARWVAQAFRWVLAALRVRLFKV
ncbi:MAG: hypothetical protein ACOY0T_26650 [Myxococcota bacterium]